MTDSAPSGMIVCWSKCWACMLGQCPGGDHRWADEHDIEHAEPYPARGALGLWRLPDRPRVSTTEETA